MLSILVIAPEELLNLIFHLCVKNANGEQHTVGECSLVMRSNISGNYGKTAKRGFYLLWYLLEKWTPLCKTKIYYLRHIENCMWTRMKEKKKNHE